MAEASQILFKLTEVAEALVKQQNLHEGNWGVIVRFGIGAANAPGPSGELLPTAIVPILEMGLQRFDEPNTLTVDATVVNPAAPKSEAKSRVRKRARK
jgi:hypothetical protein